MWTTKPRKYKNDDVKTLNQATVSNVSGALNKHAFARVCLITNKYGTQKVVAILITFISSIISCIQLNIAILNSQRDYLKKRTEIVRLLSLPAAQAAIVKQLDKKGERRKLKFLIRPGRTSAWWDGF